VVVDCTIGHTMYYSVICVDRRYSAVDWFSVTAVANWFWIRWIQTIVTEKCELAWLVSGLVFGVFNRQYVICHNVADSIIQYKSPHFFFLYTS
jgi:hypothetical protein